MASGWPYAVWLYFTGRRVAVELKRGVITFFISTFAVAIRQAETKERVKKKKEPTRYRPSGRTFNLGPPCGRLAGTLRLP